MPDCDFNHTHDPGESKNFLSKWLSLKSLFQEEEMEKADWQ